MFYTNGALTNPLANAIMADCGAIPEAGTHCFEAFVSSTVAAVVVIEWRDAANAANKWSHTLPIPANGFVYWPNVALEGMLAGERLRVRINAAVTGACQCTVAYS